MRHGLRVKHRHVPVSSAWQGKRICTFGATDHAGAMVVGDTHTTSAGVCTIRHDVGH